MPNWTPEEEEILVTLARQGKSSAQIAEYLAIKGYARSAIAVARKLERERNANPAKWLVYVPSSRTELYNKNISCEADRVLLLFDVHAPFHSAAWINRALEFALKQRCSVVGVMGDLIDFSAFSPYGREHAVEAEDEIASAREIISALASNFAEVVYVAGNHEARMVRRTEGALALMSTMEMFVQKENVRLSDYRWADFISGGERFRAVHPKNFSQTASSVARDLCSKFLCHVITGHGHSWGMTRDRSGRFWAVDAGMCADPRRLAYNIKVPSRSPEMMQGAVLLLDGVPFLISPDNIGGFEKMMNGGNGNGK